MASVIVEILSKLEERASSATPYEVRIGAHWTFVGLQINGERCGGLATTLSGGDHAAHAAGGPPVRQAGRLLHATAFELASLAQSNSLLETSVGIATINALLEVDEAECVDVNAADVIEARGAGRKIAVVGHFPFVPRLRMIAETLWVLELEPREGDLPAAQAPEVLPQADVVALTGSSLLNKTFDSLVRLCRSDAFLVVLGGTAPLSPDLLVAGVDAVAGTRVVDPEAAALAVGQGATFRQIPGKRLLTMFRDAATRRSFSRQDRAIRDRATQDRAIQDPGK